METRIHHITIGRIALHKDGFPVAALHMDGDAEPYASLIPAFRGYQCHVDGSTDLFDSNSHGAYGESPVFGLNNLFDARLGTDKNFGHQSNLKFESIKVELFKAMLYSTIRDHIRMLGNMSNRRTHSEDESVEHIYLFDDTDADYDLGDGRQMPFYGTCTRLDLLVAFTVRYMNPTLYSTWTIPIRRPIDERIEEYRAELEDPRTNESTRKYLPKWIAELEDHKKLLANLTEEAVA